MFYDLYERKTHEGESLFFQAQYFIIAKTHQREGKREFLHSRWCILLKIIFWCMAISYIYRTRENNMCDSRTCISNEKTP